MNKNYLVVAMWGGKVQKHCVKTDVPTAVEEFEVACRGLFNRNPTDEEKENGFAKDDEMFVQLLCLDENDVVVKQE